MQVIFTFIFDTKSFQEVSLKYNQFLLGISVDTKYVLWVG